MVLGRSCGRGCAYTHCSVQNSHTLTAPAPASLALSPSHPSSRATAKTTTEPCAAFPTTRKHKAFW